MLSFFVMYSSFACFVFFCKQKTAYEMRISDWSSDVCSSDLRIVSILLLPFIAGQVAQHWLRPWVLSHRQPVTILTQGGTAYGVLAQSIGGGGDRKSVVSGKSV